MFAPVVAVENATTGAVPDRHVRLRFYPTDNESTNRYA